LSKNRELALSDQDADRVRAFLVRGTEIAGPVAGRAIGLYTGGWQGALAGAALGPLATWTLEKLAVDFSNRTLSLREQMRAAGVFLMAAHELDQKIGQGYELRADGFFRGQESADGDRTIAEEVIEGVLIAAQREHEERKLPYQAKLLANIALLPEIDRANANVLIRHAEALSYRQLQLLALLARKDELGLRLGKLTREGGFPFELVTILQDFLDLFRRGLLFAPNILVVDISTVSLRNFVVEGPGAVLYQLMELRDIAREELQPLARMIHVDD
jgi:hypothetical protein